LYISYVWIKKIKVEKWSKKKKKKKKKKRKKEKKKKKKKKIKAFANKYMNIWFEYYNLLKGKGISLFVKETREWV